MNRPFSEASDRNREPILAVIEPLLRDCKAILEVGSGTGQHAVFFAARMPHLTWFTSDLPVNHPGIRQWLEEANLPNLREPLALDVASTDWPAFAIDAVFSANTTHIMSWREVEHLFRGIGNLLPSGGHFLLYGPFNYGNQYTSPSNAEFDAQLQCRDPRSGIRNFEDLDRLALAAGMTLIRDYSMPANNRILHWRKAR